MHWNVPTLFFAVFTYVAVDSAGGVQMAVPVCAAQDAVGYGTTVVPVCAAPALVFLSSPPSLHCVNSFWGA